MAAEQPTGTPSRQTAEYLAVCRTPTVLTLDQLETSARTCSRSVNAMLQQLGLWQRELRDAEFEETNGDLRVRLNNVDQRQKAMSALLMRLADELQSLRVNIKDLRIDQSELARCASLAPAEVP